MSGEAEHGEAERSETARDAYGDAVRFARYLVTALRQQNFFQPLSDNNLMRRDLGAVTYALVRVPEVGPDPRASVIELQIIIDSFIRRAVDRSEGHTVAYLLIFVIQDDDAFARVDDMFEYVQREMDEGGLVADILVVDMRTASWHAASRRKGGDRRLRATLDEAVATLSLSAEEQEQARAQTARQYGAVRRDMAPQIERRGPDPIVFLVVLNVMLFIGGRIMEHTSGADYFTVWGIQDNRLVLQGEVWRLVTSMFLHADYAHIGGNMIFLLILGRALRPYYTNGTLWTFYLVSGLVGNLVGLIDPNMLSLGASGAIMGLGGVLIYRMTLGPSAAAFRRAGNFASIAIMILYNLFYGLLAENIDNYGHFGGFIAGFLLALLWNAKRKARI